MNEIKKDIDNLETITKLVYERRQLVSAYNRLLIVVIVLAIAVISLMYFTSTLLTLLDNA